MERTLAKIAGSSPEYGAHWPLVADLKEIMSSSVFLCVLSAGRVASMH